VEPPATPVTLGLDLGLSDAAESYASDTGDSSDPVAVQAFESVPVVAEQCQIPYLLLVTVDGSMVLIGSQDKNTIRHGMIGTRQYGDPLPGACARATLSDAAASAGDPVQRASVGRRPRPVTSPTRQRRIGNKP
jgi:hypothetical protein